MRNSWCVGNGQTQGLRLQNVCGTLNCMHDEQIILYDEEKENDGVKEYIVRRLTPLECTRLQGFPDHWVDLGDWTDSKGKRHKDSNGPKYKALGNSIALPFWHQLLGNISMVLDREDTQPRKHTLGSLFDGIGGFPLCWAAHNGAETVRWNSEIEEFPEAVVTRHFGDEDLGIEGDINQFINVGEREHG